MTWHDCPRLALNTNCWYAFIITLDALGIDVIEETVALYAQILYT